MKPSDPFTTITFQPLLVLDLFRVLCLESVDGLSSKSCPAPLKSSSDTTEGQNPVTTSNVPVLHMGKSHFPILMHLKTQ